MLFLKKKNYAQTNKSDRDICRVSWSDLKPICTSIRHYHLSLTKPKKKRKEKEDIAFSISSSNPLEWSAKNKRTSQFPFA